MLNTLSAEERNAGYRLLFDGRTLDGWDCTGDPQGWGVEDGSIVCNLNKGRFLFTQERFDDFPLSVDNIVQITLNGRQVIDMNLDHWTTPRQNPDGTPNKFKRADKALPRSGRICLQDHGGKAWFRNIKLLPL